MADNVSDLVLDGNAAAGCLQEIFAGDITIAQIQCEACGSTRSVGSLRLYAASMGAVLRCSQCIRNAFATLHSPGSRTER